MKNDNLFSSLSRMAEEYNRMVSPLTKQLGIYDSWSKIDSPILRVAKFNHEVLKGIATVDPCLGKQLASITKPYSSVLDDILTNEINRQARFQNPIHLQVYVPKVSSVIDMLASSSTESRNKVEGIYSKKMNPFEMTSAITLTPQSLKPWKTSLSEIKAFDTSMIDSCFSRLVEMEKTVTNISGVMRQYDHINSISTQLASLQQIGLDDAWKRVITPPKLLMKLNDFALKQYEQIQKAGDDQTISWRLGLIGAASKYVDSQVSWGTTLAVDINGSPPKDEISIPDFSELPNLLGPAKRCHKDVEEAFDESQLVEITSIGKLIIQKAKVVNDYCKVRGISLLFPERDLLDWAMILAGSFCRDTNKLNEVLDTLYNMFVREPIMNLIGYHKCFTELRPTRGVLETKKRDITRIQKRIYYQVICLEEELIKHFEDTVVSHFDEDTVSANVLKALLTVQKDKIYESVKENSINDGIRNQLGWIYEVKDQTRQGDSESGQDAGEVDILLCDNGNPAVIIEGLKMDSFKQDYLDKHIYKALKNYDPNGCSLVYILIYATVKRFDGFWNKIMTHLNSFNYPYEAVKSAYEIPTAYTESRHAKAILKRSGKEIKLHFYAIAMR